MMRRDRYHGLAKRAVLLCAATIALHGCGGGQPSAGDGAGGSPAPSQLAADSMHADSAGAGAGGAVPEGCDNLHESILAVRPTRDAFAAAFGQPDTVLATTEPNRHVQNAVDSLFTVSYPGFVMEIRTPSRARDMATSVQVEDNRYIAYPGIGIGSPVSRLEEVLGPATTSRGDRVTYDCGVEVEQPVTFVIDDGRVVRIEISYYVD